MDGHQDASPRERQPQGLDNRTLVRGYLRAKGYVIAARFEGDISWAEQLLLVRPNAVDVLRETAWVIVCSGFRALVARKMWPGLTEAYHQWDPTKVDRWCVERARRTLGHRGKLKAIVKVAETIRTEGHERIVADAAHPERLQRLPWVGPITCYHLAKLLGQDVVKPDIHLQRAAKAAAVASPLELATRVKRATGDPLTVIDSVLWRYGEQRRLQGWPSWEELLGVQPRTAALGA